MSVYVKTSSGVTPIANLQEMGHRQYIFIGDSWGAGVSLSDGNLKYTTVLANMLRSYDNKSIFYISAVSGAGFTIANNTFLAQLENAYTAITGSTQTDITDPNAVTDIIVLGGLNDKSSTVSNISIKIAQFISVARSKFPNAIIRVGCIGRSTRFSDNWPCYCNSYQAYHDATINNGGAYIDGSEWCMHYYNALQTDYYHPDSTGHALIARFLFQYLTTGKGSYNSPIHAVGALNNLCSGTEGNRPTIDTSFYTFQQDGMIVFQNVGITAINKLNSGTSLQSGTEIYPLNGDINVLGYFGGAIDNCFWNATHTQITIGYNNGSSWKNVDAEVSPLCNTVNSEFRFKIKLFEPSGNSFSNITSFQIHPFTIVAPWYMC